MGEKFACWFFSDAHVGHDFPADAHVANEVYAARALSVDWAPHWREWLGSMTADAVAGLGLYVTGPSAHPEVLDADNEALRHRIDDVLHGLLVQGVPTFNQGFFLTAAPAISSGNQRFHRPTAR